MPDPYEPEGTLPSLLRFVDRSGQVLRNTMRGRPASAGRQLVDIFGDIIDAPLPGDWIPSASSPEDYVSGSELVGLGDMEPGFTKTAVDIGVGMATDPLTYVGFGAATKPLQAATGLKHSVKVGIPFTNLNAVEIATKEAMDPLSLVGRTTDKAITGAAKKVDQFTGKSSTIAGQQRPGLESAYEGLKGGVRRTLGWEQLSPEIKTQLTLAKAAGKTASDVYLKRINALFKGTSQDDRNILTLAHMGVDTGSLNPSAVKAMEVLPAYDTHDAIAELGRRYNKSPSDISRLQSIADQMKEIHANQWDELVKSGVVKDASKSGRIDYLQRQWIADDFGEAGGLKQASLKSPQDIVEFYNKGGVGIELDAAKLMAQRAAQQGKYLSKTKLARNYGTGILRGEADESLLANAKSTIESSALNADEKTRLMRELDGYDPRKGLMSVVAKLNRVVKPSLVYGVVLPKVGAQVRNKIGQVWQAATTEGVGREGMTAQLKTAVQDLFRSADEAYAKDMYGVSFIPADEIGKSIDLIDNAVKQAKTGDEVATILRSQGRTDLADAVEYGVMDGFVSTEEIIKDIQRTPKAQRWMDLYEAPGRMFQYVEQRARLREFLRSKQAGNSPAEAARLTNEAFLDYSITGPENRTLRDIIPFAQFLAQSIPQQAKALSRTPAVAAGLTPLFTDPSGENEPIYPWMEGKTRIAAGKTDTGNLLYLTGFGLPVESLEAIPNLSADPLRAGRQIQGGPVASMQPLLKTGISAITGEDLYFDSPAFSYGKLPIVGEAGETGRTINAIAGTGLLEPLGYGMIRQAGQLMQEDRPLEARAADVLTGAKLTEVDPDLAEQRQIQEYLSRKPDIKRYTSFYGDLDEETKQLLEDLKDSKRRSKMKRDAGISAE